MNRKLRRIISGARKRYPYAMEQKETVKSSRLRRWIIPVIGGITPTLLIVVNVAVVIVHHLGTLRLGITGAAFLSTIVLGAWQALNFYRIVKALRPDLSIHEERNEDLLVVIGMTAVVALAALVAFLCWMGLSDEKSLPNVGTFVAGAISILVAVVMPKIFRRSLKKSLRRGKVFSQIKQK